jgi:hypothetical protein
MCSQIRLPLKIAKSTFLVVITSVDQNGGVFPLPKGDFFIRRFLRSLWNFPGWNENGQVVNIAISFNLVLCDSGGMAYNPVL